MSVPKPHYLLFSEANSGCGMSRWRFTLRTVDGSEQFEAADVEPEIGGERLDLLTVVRALEALDQPSQVTLIGCSEALRRGMQYGLPEWRDNGWQWESFGQMVPVRNGDLWQRLDRALRFHRVECRQWRLDAPEPRLARPEAPQPGGGLGVSITGEHRVGYWPLPLLRGCGRWIAALCRWRGWAVRLSSCLPTWGLIPVGGILVAKAKGHRYREIEAVVE